RGRAGGADLGRGGQQRPAAGAGLHRVPAQPVQPDPDRPAGRRPGGVGAASAFWFAGLFALALLFFKYESPILLIVLLFACYELYRRWSRRNMPGFDEYHAVTIPQRIGIAAVYLGLVV